MDEFLKQLGHEQTRWPLVIVLLLGGLSLLVRWLAAWRVKRDIDANDARLGAALAEAEEKGPKAGAAARLLGDVVSLVEDRLPADAEHPSRWLVKADIGPAYEASCELAAGGRNLISRLFNGVGQSLTGIALVFTFVLIAWVLATEVPRAIGGVTQGGDAASSLAANAALQNAVALIGAKFTVSALGLLLSLFFRVVESGTGVWVASHARHSAHLHRALFVSHETHRHELLIRELRAVRESADAASARLGQRLEGAFRTQTNELRVKLEGLASIEVSVKEMGEEISTHLGNIMKNQVADQICGSLNDLKGFAEEMVERVQKANRGDQQALLGALGEVRTTIAQQSKSDLEQLAEQMRGMVSTGFESESKNMASAMSALVQVLPSLERQMRHMAEDVDRQMRERAESNARVQTDLFSELRSMLAANQEHMAGMKEASGQLLTAANGVVGNLLESVERLSGDLHRRVLTSGEETLARLTGATETQMRRLAEDVDRQSRVRAETDARLQEGILGDLRAMVTENRGQMTAMTEANQQLQSASERAVAQLVGHTERLSGELQQRMVESGQETLAALAAASTGGVNEIRHQLADLTQLTATTIERFTHEVDAAQAAFAGARESLVGSVESLATMAKELRQDLSHSAEAGRASQAALETFRQSARSMETAGTTIDRAVSSLASRLTTEQELLAGQRELADKVMPQVIDRYSKAVEAQMERLASTWSSLSKNVERTVAGAGDNLAQNIEDLSAEVASFKSAVAGLEKAVTTRR